MLQLIRSIDISASCVGFVGIIVGLLIAQLSFTDRQYAKRAKRNGWFLLHAIVGMRTGISISISHLIIGTIALLAFFNPPPDPKRYALALGFAAAYLILQTSVIIPQILNLIDGYRLRRKS